MWQAELFSPQKSIAYSPEHSLYWCMNLNSRDIVRILVLDNLNSKEIETALRECEFKYVFRQADLKLHFLRELREFHPHIILSNYTLSDSEGLEALILSKDIAPDAPFIFVTNHNGEDIAIRCMKAGAADYILKQNISQLPEILEGVLERVRSKSLTTPTDISDTEFKQIIQSSKDLIAVIDRDGHRLYASPSYLEFLDSTQLRPGTSIFDEIDNQDVHRVKQLYYDVIESEKSQRAEYSITSRNNKVVFVEATWSPIFSDSKRPTHFMVVSRVMTRRKRAEDALKENIKHFRALVENIADAISLVNPYGIVLFTSRSTGRILGYKINEFVGRNFFDVIHPSDLSMATHYFKIVQKQSGSAPDIQLRFLHKDGSYRWMDCIGNNLLNEPAVNGIVFNYRDITEKKNSEEALRTQDALFRALIENSEDEISLVGADGKIIYQINSINGYAEGESRGQKAFAFIHPDDLERMSERFAKLAIEFGQIISDEFRTLHRDGSWRWIECVAKNLMNDKAIKAIVINSRDISDRKSAENALASERERLAVTLRSLTDAVLATNTEGRIILANDSAHRLLRSKGTLVDCLVEDVVTLFDEKGMEKVENPIRPVIRSKKKSETAYYVITFPENERFTVSANAAPISDTQNALVGAVLILRDVTEKLRMESELLKSRKIESIGVLAGGIAHDFNNILSAILGNISLAKSKIATNNTDKSIELLSRAEKASERAKELTQQLLTFSKGGAPIRQTGNIVAIVRESADFSLAGSNVRCEFEVDENVLSVEMDAGQISQVINNLIINARQAMPNGGTIDISIRQLDIVKGMPYYGLSLESGKYVAITIRDRGIGISEENIQRIFDPYFTTKHTGHGLGLATSYSIITNHQGAIAVESAIGQGTTFRILLPSSSKHNDDTPLILVANPQLKGRVLVMDDEESVREMASSMLNHLGFDVVCARDGVQAIELYKKSIAQKEPFLAVIMDLTIPGGLGGRETIRQLIELDSDVNAIVSSGYSNDPVMADYKQFGFKNVLPKPYFVNDLATVINSLGLEIPAHG